MRNRFPSRDRHTTAKTAPAPRGRSRIRFAVPLRAGLAAMLGAIPALVIASSARAAGSTPADDWTMGLLALAFASMLLVLALMGTRLSKGLRQGIAARDGHRDGGEFR